MLCFFIHISMTSIISKLSDSGHFILKELSQPIKMNYDMGILMFFL